MVLASSKHPKYGRVVICDSSSACVERSARYKTFLLGLRAAIFLHQAFRDELAHIFIIFGDLKVKSGNVLLIRPQIFTSNSMLLSVYLRVCAVGSSYRLCSELA
jgi:hypothetical protein